jgi:hypothetical protein
MQYPTEEMLRSARPPGPYYSQNFYPSVGIASLSGAVPAEMAVTRVGAQNT